MTKVIYLCFVLFSLFYKINCFNFTDCGSSATILDASVNGCPVSMDICDLPTGTNATFNSTFMSQIESRNATVAVKAKVGPIWINFPLHATDACKFWGVSCPLETGGKYGISVGVPVIQGYPKFKTVVKVQLMDERGDFIVCQSFPAQIVDSNEI